VNVTINSYFPNLVRYFLTSFAIIGLSRNSVLRWFKIAAGSVQPCLPVANTTHQPPLLQTMTS